MGYYQIPYQASAVGLDRRFARRLFNPQPEPPVRPGFPRGFGAVDPAGVCTQLYDAVWTQHSRTASQDTRQATEVKLSGWMRDAVRIACQSIANGAPVSSPAVQDARWRFIQLHVQLQCWRYYYNTGYAAPNAHVAESAWNGALMRCQLTQGPMRARPRTMQRRYTALPSRFSGLGQPPGASAAAPYCSGAGNYAALQQMLADLGYYLGPIDGTMSAGGPTEQAVIQFGKLEGIGLSGGITAAYCERLIQRWNERFGPGAEPVPLPETGMRQALVSSKQLRYRAPATAQPRTQAPSTPAQAATGPSPLDKVGSWWQSQSGLAKAGYITAGAVSVGALIYFAR